MTYEEFLDANRNKLLGHFMLAEILTNTDCLDTPYPPSGLSAELLTKLKARLNECIPLESMITDLWDWNIRFEDDLSDDWYFEAVFGSASSLEPCAQQLAEFFVAKCDEGDIDYNQSRNYPEFERLLGEQASHFILDWRKNVFARYAQPGTAMAVPRAARPELERCAAMPTHWGWMFGKVAKAVEILVTNHHDVRNRVWVASTYLMILHPESVPERCREDVIWIHGMLTRYPASGYYKTPIEATYRRTRNRTAETIAHRVWKLYHEFDTALQAREQEQREPLTSRSTRTRAKAARAG